MRTCVDPLTVCVLNFPLPYSSSPLIAGSGFCVCFLNPVKCLVFQRSCLGYGLWVLCLGPLAQALAWQQNAVLCGQRESSRVLPSSTVAHKACVRHLEMRVLKTTKTSVLWRFLNLAVPNVCDGSCLGCVYCIIEVWRESIVHSGSLGAPATVTSFRQCGDTLCETKWPDKEVSPTSAWL